MTPDRREFLAASLLAVSRGPQPEKAPPMGVIVHSYGIHSGADRGGAGKPGFADPLRFLEFCRQREAGGMQLPLGVRDKDYAAKVRTNAAKAKMYVEGSVRLPKDRKDVERFAAEVGTAKECGAGVLRVAILSGRRYETFSTAAEFRRFAEQSYESLGLAEPVVAKAGMRLAVENHKDWRADELLAMLKKLGSRRVGVNVDTGNSISLLEDPYEVVEAFAPLAFSTHIKDVGVREYDDGFLLSEVPLGTGFLDLKRIIQTLRKARPEVKFNLEMITRDPLKVPCLTDKYWATFEKLPGKYLARTLAMVRKHASKKPLPMVSGLTAEKKLKMEDDYVRQSLTFARKQLGL